MRPSGVTTAFPSSQPENSPPSQSGVSGQRVDDVQLDAFRRSAPSGADIVKRKCRPPPAPMSSIPRQIRPSWTTTG